MKKQRKFGKHHSDDFKANHDRDLDINRADEHIKNVDSAFFQNVLDAVIIALFNYFRLVGIYTIKVLRKIKRIYLIAYRHVLKRPIESIERLILNIAKQFGRFARFVMFKAYMFIKFFVDAKNVLVAGFNKNNGKNIARRLWDTVVAFFKGVYNNRRIFVTWINYALPVVSIVAFVYLINYVSSLNFAVAVEYNDHDLGYIESEAVFESAEAKFQQRVIYTEGDEAIDNIPVFSVKVVQSNRIKDELQIADALIKSVSDDVVKATGITIDGTFYGAVENGHIIKQTLDSIKEQYKTPETLKVEFAKDIQLSPGLYQSKNIKPENNIISVLTKEEETDAYVEVKEGDTPIEIASANDLSLDELVALNPGIMDSLVVGRPVLVKKSKHFIPVAITKSVSYTEKIPHETTVTESSKIYNGIESVTREGENGERVVTANVKLVDGVEISKEIISQSVVKDPVTELVTRGTGGYASLSGNVMPSGDGKFIWPTYGGYISSPFGWRSDGNHTGLDYATAYGTPVVASLPGKVFFAGWNSSYGYLIKIDHGAGLHTYYAHNSRLLVKAGQWVEQGEAIARIGSTGRSFGNHCHFEVRINNSPQDPLKYLP